MCENFGVNSVAPVRAVADGLIVGAEHWMCADPVHLQLQQSQVILQPEVKCGAEESAALCAELNRHFEQDGLMFIASDPQRWYVRSAANSDVATTPLRVAAWRDVKAYQPEGKDALRWRSLANEIQMLLHEHPVNTAREARGLPTINSLWLWGGGCASSIDSNLEVLGSDESLIPSFAQAGGIAYATSVEEMLKGNKRYGLWVQTALATA
ncbi:MAG: hypothetical protein PXX77_01330, partial [Gallionella sp.]|nr:hypothetical protein [Gallionella sp.]